MIDEYLWKEYHEAERPQTKTVMFGPRKPFVAITYEDGPKATNLDKMKQEHCEVYLADHPLVIVENPGDEAINVGKRALFKLVDLQKESASSVTTIDKKVQVANLINGMEEETLRDIIYYFGQVPGADTLDDMKIRLMDFNEGICMVETNIDIFLSQWGDDKYKDQLEIVINVNKAIDLGIIVEKTIGRINNYMIGDEILGSTKEQVVAFLKEKRKLYEANVKRLIEERDEPRTENLTKEPEEKDELDTRQVHRMKEEMMKGQREGHFNKRNRIDKMGDRRIQEEYQKWNKGKNINITKQTA